MPTVNFIRSIMPAREPLGLAANYIREKNPNAAKQVLLKEYRLMVQFGVEPGDAERSLKTRLTAKLVGKIPKTDGNARDEWKDVVDDLVDAVTGN
jgi:sporulation-control protein spo0M